MTKRTKAEDPADASTEIVAYKGFDENLQCRGYQFEVGKTYEHAGRVAICEGGFHACTNPLDVLNYYDITGRFATVRLGGEVSKRADGDSKVAAARITIDAELTLPAFIKAAIAAVAALCKAGTLNEGAQSASGNYSQLAASGDYSKLAASGNSSKLAASGNYSKLAASGNSSKLAASGDSSQLAASGDYSQLAASGKNSVIVASAPGAIAKGADGTWMSLADFDAAGKCIGFAEGCIGNDGLVADTFYRASGGKLVPA